MPGVARETVRPVGHGVTPIYHLNAPFVLTRKRSTQKAIGISGHPSGRTLREGSFVTAIPGNKLPGYLHSVHSGQEPPHLRHGRFHIREIQFRFIGDRVWR
jgi:hypothetical protein